MGKSSLPTFNVFTTIPCCLKTLKLSSSQGVKSLLKSRAGSISLVALLGCTGVSWLVQSAIAPHVAQAYTANVEVSISSQGESYDTVVRRAEAIARAAAQRNFDRDILVTDVAVMVMAENEGFIAPIVLLRVSRPAWKSSPDPQRWATYFPATKSLLGFTDTVNPAVQPVPVAPQTLPPATNTPVPQQPQTAPGTLPPPNQQNQTPGATPPPNTANPATPQNQTPPPNTANPATPQNQTPPPNTANPATPQNQTPPPNTANPATPQNQTPPPAGTGSNPEQNPLTPTVPPSNVPQTP